MWAAVPVQSSRCIVAVQLECQQGLQSRAARVRQQLHPPMAGSQALLAVAPCALAPPVPWSPPFHPSGDSPAIRSAAFARLLHKQLRFFRWVAATTYYWYIPYVVCADAPCRCLASTDRGQMTGCYSPPVPCHRGRGAD